MASHRHFLRLLDDPFFPFPPPPPAFDSDDFSSAPPFPDLDLFLPPAAPPPPLDPFFSFPYPFLLRDLTDRVAALELAVAPRRPEPTTRKRTYVTEAAGGRRVKWTSVEKPRAGERTLKWEAEVRGSPHDDDGFDRKWKWEATKAGSAATKLKWGAAVKGKGRLEPWSQAYTWEEDFAASDSDYDYDAHDEEEQEHAHAHAHAHSTTGRPRLTTRRRRPRPPRRRRRRRNAPLPPSRSRRSPMTTMLDASPSERLLLRAMARERGRSSPLRTPPYSSR
ncbi:hypothetical protein BS78_10G003000 [Paspalum vaginatum]|nr:hypothetical protein BS78_10G003000 [Paspalum vaginatum]